MNRRTARHLCRTLCTALTAVIATVLVCAGPAAAQTVQNSFVLLSQLDRSRVPVWTDEQITAQFQRIRDTRFLYENGDTSNPRRLTWLDPSGGASERADLACYLMLSDPSVQAAPPMKIWARYMDGDFTVYTPYSASGDVSWWIDMAPVVRNTLGDLIVLDPALNHCKPLKLEEWLGLMVDGHIEVFDNPASYYQVALSDYKAVNGTDQAFNEPTAYTHEAESRASMQMANGYLYHERVNLLSFNTPAKVNEMLGATPPWGGNNCTTFYNSFVMLSQLDTSKVSVWTDAQILEQFKVIRDTRYLYETGNTTTARRLPWMDASLWCQDRADLACYLMLSDANVNKYPYVKANPPWKVKAIEDGDFSAYTPFSGNSGYSWSNHIAPAVKNTRGEIIVLDPAMNQCQPLKLQEWLAILTNGDISGFDNPNEGHPRVALADYRAYADDDPAVNNPDATKKLEAQHLANSMAAIQGNLVNERTNLQTLFPTKASQLLGSSPPWTGNTCVSIALRRPTYIGSPTVGRQENFCPSGALAVGGGYSTTSAQMAPVGTGKLNNGTEGWWADFNFNLSGVGQSLTSAAACLTGAPQNATVTKVTGATQSVSASGTVKVTAVCSSGLLVGGGYLTATSSSSSAPIVRVFRNARSASSSKTWEVSAYNPGNAAKTITAYAVCLNNTTYTVSQASGTLAANGTAKASCAAGLRTIGGGFEFSQSKAYTVTSMKNLGVGEYAVTMTPAPASGDTAAKAYVMCLKTQ